METRLHMIGNAHLDPVWLWTWQEGFMESIATFRSALDRIRESDDFIFTASSAQYYQWIEEHDPQMFEEIQAAVRNGRWRIVGGWWIQPDDNMPSGESFARQGLYSQQYYREKFGVICKTGYCVDTFGHNAEIPKLLQAAGMENFVFMRPGRHENPDVPPVFWWDAADGSRVLTFQIQNAYCERLESIEHLDAMYELTQKLGCDLMSFYGVGNHGGGPTRRQIERIRAYEKEHPGRVLLSDPDQAFDTIRSQNAALPVWNGELQHHASGCYSAVSELKLAHRQTEQSLLAAEKICAVVSAMGLKAYPVELFREDWKNVLFNEFHDIMCGCCAKIGIDEAMETFHETRARASRMFHKTLGKLCKQIDTMIDGVSNAGKSDWQLWEEGDHGVPVVIFNPHAWDFRGNISVNAKLAGVADPDGNPVSVQYIPGDTANGSDMFDTLFPVEIPSLGYAVYWAYKNTQLHPSGVVGKIEVETACKPKAAYVLENEYLSVRLNPENGHIVSLFDKRNDRELCDGDCGVPVVIDDTLNDTWAHARFVFREELARLRCESIGWRETGELRNTIRVAYRYEDSRFWLDYSLDRLSEQLNVRMKAVWQTPHTILKLAFPLQLSDCASAAQIPYGRIQRPSNAEEEPMQQWCALLGADSEGKTAGLAVLNNGRYSYDAKDNELRVTLLRNCLYGDHFAETRRLVSDFVDEGLHYLTMAIRPLNGTPNGELDRAAAELNFAPVAVFDNYHTGSMGRVASFASVDGESVNLEVVKGAENGKGYVFRLWETTGNAVSCTLRSDLFGIEQTLSFAPLEVKTLVLDSQTHAVRETNFLED